MPYLLRRSRNLALSQPVHRCHRHAIDSVVRGWHHDHHDRDTNNSGLAAVYAIGFGVGHERLSGSADSAAEMISYLTPLFGKWEISRRPRGAWALKDA